METSMQWSQILFTGFLSSLGYFCEVFLLTQSQDLSVLEETGMEKWARDNPSYALEET